MTFSIIIPVYNVRDYLEKCVDSVLAQVGSDCEIILVDDGSTDGASPGLCDAYALRFPTQIRVIHKPNGGLGDARNVGLEQALGDYVAFFDSDDFILPDLLQSVREAVQTYDCDIVDYGFQVVDENGAVRERYAGTLPSNTAFTLVSYPRLLLTLPSACCRFFRRRLFLDSGIRFPAGVWYEDIRTTLKLFALARSVVSLPQAYYAYVAREGSITRNNNIARNVEILDAFEDLQAWFSSQGLWETYYNEFCKLAVDHILLAASVRVLRVDPKSELLQQFQDFVAAHFPNYMENPYLPELSAPHKVALKLLRGKHYTAVQTLFALKDRFS